MTNVTKIRRTVEDEFVQLIKDSESLVLIGKTKDDLKMMTNVSNNEAVMLLEAIKLELLGAYIDGVLGEELQAALLGTLKCV